MTVRVVSLVPSVTETLLAWGVEPVAVTRFCEQPGYPTVGGTKNPDIDAIVALAPDLVVVDQEENRLVDADALRHAGVPLHVLHIRSMRDLPGALAGLRHAVGVAPLADDGPPRVVEVQERPEAAMPAPPQGAAGMPTPLLQAWVPIWRRPWMTIGATTYAASLLEDIGVGNVYADATDPYPIVELDEVRARHPDVVLAPSEPYAFDERHRDELESVAPVLFVDGHDLFWWGARTPGARQRLTSVIFGRP